MIGTFQSPCTDVNELCVTLLSRLCALGMNVMSIQLGVTLLAVDNVNRTAPEIRLIFRRGQLGASGSNKLLFDQVGIVEAYQSDPQAVENQTTTNPEFLDESYPPTPGEPLLTGSAVPAAQRRRLPPRTGLRSVQAGYRYHQRRINLMYIGLGTLILIVLVVLLLS